MKSKTIAIITCSGLFATAAFADITVDITGATAFRAATLDALKAQFTASGQPYQYAHDKAAGAYSGATLSIWKGTFPGIPGVTTVRTSFNGSVQGIRALVDSPAQDPSYYTDIAGNLITAAALGGGETNKDTATFAKTTATSQSEIAFSDVSVASTPYAASSLQPTDPAAGVVVFTMLTNEGSTITNVTEQNFRALLTTGFQPKSLFTGIAADEDLVLATGRNDGSGTRTAYLSESGYGITTLVQQFIINESSGNENTVIQLCPAGGVNDSNLVTPGIQAYTGQSASNASTVWGQDQAGNGGYNSGSGLVAAMGRQCTAAELRDDSYGLIDTLPLSLVTWISLNDAITSRDLGAKFCAYNGVKLDGIAAGGGTMTTADLEKVTHGAYTAWSYQQMYRRNDITSGDGVTFYNNLKTAIGSNLAAAGVPVGSMAVARAADGGVVGTTAF